MRSPSAFRAARAASVFLVAVMAVEGAASALTIASVTGSGDLEISATGAVYFDGTGLVLTDITLIADTAHLGAGSYPAGVPGAATDTIELFDVSDATDLSVEGDLYLDLFEFAGSLTIEATSIYGIGSIEFSGDMDVGGGPGGSDSCPGSSSGGTIVLTSGGTGSVSICVGEIGTNPIGPIVVIPGDPVITPSVPEPTSGLLYGIGAAVLVARLRRR